MEFQLMIKMSAFAFAMTTALCIAPFASAQDSGQDSAQGHQPKPGALLLVQQFIAQNKKLSVTATLEDGMPTVTSLSPAAQAQIPANGPLITRVEAIREGEPVFKKFAHPVAGPGQKIVMVTLPRTSKGKFATDKFQVSVTFTVLRDADACNQTRVSGAVSLTPVPAASYLSSYTLTIKPDTSSITLMACDDHRRTPKQIEIFTELENPRPFHDNLVFYVPSDVTVKAKIWKAATTVEAKSPEEAEAIEDFGSSEANN